MHLFHFTNSYIEKFVHTKPKRSYSKATGKGVYFTPSFEKGMLKYGEKSKYCYICDFKGNLLDLGEFDAMYFDGRMIHSCHLVSENFRRALEGKRLIKNPDIILESLSTKAFNWLKERKIDALQGMDYWGYACPEIAVLTLSCITIKNVVVL